MRRALLPLVFVWATAALGQVDSLVRVLHTLPQDTSRLPVLTGIIRALVFTEPDSALPFAQQYRSLGDKVGNGFHSAKGENFIGMCYATQSDYAAALPHYLKALEGFERAGDAWYTAMLHNNIGGVHIEQEAMEKARQEFQAAYTGFEQLRDTVWMVNVLNNLGNVHFHAQRYDSSEVMYSQAAKALDLAGMREHSGTAWLNVGNSHYNRDRFEEALAAYDSVLVRIPAGSDDHALCMAVQGQGASLLRLGRVREAYPVLQDGLARAQRVGVAQQEALGHLRLSEWYLLTGRYDSAGYHRRAHDRMRDSVFSEENAARINELQERYESGKKDLQIAENKAMLERRALTIKAVAVGAALLLLAALFALRAYRVKKRTSDALAVKNATIDAQLKEKELLLREIHHRVKNNLQTVSSLLSIQGRAITDEKAKEAVNDSRLRVKSMALIHQDLYREGDLTGVQMQDYVEKLATGLVTSYGKADHVALDLRVEPISLDVDTAVPLGLILNELITNALKYAWPDNASGRLSIALREQTVPEAALVIDVQDNGVGMKDATKVSEGGTGFGLGMIRTFASKLKAEHTISGEGGTLVRLVVRNYRKSA